VKTRLAEGQLHLLLLLRTLFLADSPHRPLAGLNSEPADLLDLLAVAYPQFSSLQEIETTSSAFLTPFHLQFKKNPGPHGEGLSDPQPEMDAPQAPEVAVQPEMAFDQSDQPRQFWTKFLEMI
jgi:hypothetical protein